METIYVFLPNEGTDVWAPVDAERVREGIYRIVDCRREDDEVQFRKGTLVRCRHQNLSGGTHLVAYEAVE
jgi:hypothetical protein